MLELSAAAPSGRESDFVTLSRDPSASSAARALRAGGAGRWRVAGGRLHCDAGARRLLGVAARVSLRRWLDALPPADATALRAAFDAGSVSHVLRGVLLAGSAHEGIAIALPSRDDFFAGVSHELRTPLNAILGFSRLARAELGDGPARAHLDRIDASSRLMLHVVNDLLDLAQLEAGRLSIDPDRPLAPHALVTRVGQYAAGLRQDKPVALYAHTDAACPARLRGDALRIEQVLLNLVGNALKYTPRGSVVLAVKTLARANGRATLRFAVSDTGSGIALARLERIGQPFERAASPALPQAEGSGLGLSLVRRLLALLGTELRLASVDGGGTLAWFDLSFTIGDEPEAALQPEARLVSTDRRLAQTVATQWRAHGRRLGDDAARRVLLDVDTPGADARAAQLAAAGLEVLRVSARPVPGAIALPLLADALFGSAAAPGAPAAADPRLAGLRVLVAEDNPLNQQVLAALLLQHGVAAAIEGDAVSALARAWREHVDAALLDIQLGADSGFDLARQLRAMPGREALPLVFLSAHLGAAERAAAQSLGALGCLLKPYEPDELVELLRRVPHGAEAPPVLPIATADLRRLFRDTWPAQRARIRGDGDTLRRGLHALRGSLALLGERAALALAREIEDGIAAGIPAAQLPVAALLARADAIAAG